MESPLAGQNYVTVSPLPVLGMTAGKGECLMRDVSQSFPTAPPLGNSLVLKLDAELREGGAEQLHGLVIEGAGQLGVAFRGVGFRVELNAREWAYLAVVAAQMAEACAKREIAVMAQPLHRQEEVAGHA